MSNSKKILYYRERAIKNAIFNYFVKRYYEFGKFVIRYPNVFECLNEWSFEKFGVKLGAESFSNCLKRVPEIKILRNTRGHASKNKIEGMRLNQMGQKKFNVKNKCNLDIKVPGSHKEACVLVSCMPGQQELEDMYNDFDDCVKVLFDLDKVKDMYKKIEKVLFQKNEYRLTKIKISYALYLSNESVSQKEVCNLTHTTDTSLRALRKVVGLFEEKGKCNYNDRRRKATKKRQEITRAKKEYQKNKIEKRQEKIRKEQERKRKDGEYQKSICSICGEKLEEVGDVWCSYKCVDKWLEGFEFS